MGKTANKTILVATVIIAVLLLGGAYFLTTTESSPYLQSNIGLQPNITCVPAPDSRLSAEQFISIASNYLIQRLGKTYFQSYLTMNPCLATIPYYPNNQSYNASTNIGITSVTFLEKIPYSNGTTVGNVPICRFNLSNGIYGAESGCSVQDNLSVTMVGSNSTAISYVGPPPNPYIINISRSRALAIAEQDYNFTKSSTASLRIDIPISNYNYNQSPLVWHVEDGKLSTSGLYPNGDYRKAVDINVENGTATEFVIYYISGNKSNSFPTGLIHNSTNKTIKIASDYMTDKLEAYYFNSSLSLIRGITSNMTNYSYVYFLYRVPFSKNTAPSIIKDSKCPDFLPSYLIQSCSINGKVVVDVGINETGNVTYYNGPAKPYIINVSESKAIAIAHSYGVNSSVASLIMNNYYNGSYNYYNFSWEVGGFCNYSGMIFININGSTSGQRYHAVDGC